MNYEILETAYWDRQKTRVEVLRQKIADRPVLGSGRVVPDDESLAIGAGVRLTMAVMFIDICSFSQRASETVEEQDLMLRVLNLYFTEMIRIAEEYDGNVEKNTGDGLLIYFKDREGTPPTNGSTRALSCALSMFYATQMLINPILKISGVADIDFRVSIDWGAVAVARIGAPRLFNANVAIGTTANFASKMLRHAEANEIVIGASAKEQLPQAWQDTYAEVVSVPTGWTYRRDNSPYVLYRYKGRWSGPR